MDHSSGFTSALLFDMSPGHPGIFYKVQSLPLLAFDGNGAGTPCVPSKTCSLALPLLVGGVWCYFKLDFMVYKYAYMCGFTSVTIGRDTSLKEFLVLIDTLKAAHILTAMVSNDCWQEAVEPELLQYPYINIYILWIFPTFVKSNKQYKITNLICWCDI